jgi:hypothetical protein
LLSELQMGFHTPETPAQKKWPAFKVLTCGDFWDFSSAKLPQICQS